MKKYAADAIHVTVHSLRRSSNDFAHLKCIFDAGQNLATFKLAAHSLTASVKLAYEQYSIRHFDEAASDSDIHVRVLLVIVRKHQTSKPLRIHSPNEAQDICLEQQLGN